MSPGNIYLFFPSKYLSVEFVDDIGNGLLFGSSKKIYTHLSLDFSFHRDGGNKTLSNYLLLYRKKVIFFFHLDTFTTNWRFTNKLRSYPQWHTEIDFLLMWPPIQMNRGLNGRNNEFLVYQCRFSLKMMVWYWWRS